MTKSLLALIITNFLLLTLIQVTQVFIVPIYASGFADIGTKLPALSQLVIDWTGYCKYSRWGGDPLLGLFALGLAICYAKGLALRKCLRLLMWFQALVLLAMLIGLALPSF